MEDRRRAVRNERIRILREEARQQVERLGYKVAQGHQDQVERYAKGVVSINLEGGGTLETCANAGDFYHTVTRDGKQFLFRGLTLIREEVNVAEAG